MLLQRGIPKRTYLMINDCVFMQNNKGVEFVFDLNCFLRDRQMNQQKLFTYEGTYFKFEKQKNYRPKKRLAVREYLSGKRITYSIANKYEAASASVQKWADRYKMV